MLKNLPKDTHNLRIPCSHFQGFGFMVTFLGVFLLKSVGVEEVPMYVTWMRTHRLVSLLLIWVGGNFVHGLLFGTGAFEVYYDGQLVRLAFYGSFYINFFLKKKSVRAIG